jgi:hypothetical protein
VSLLVAAVGCDTQPKQRAPSGWQHLQVMPDGRGNMAAAAAAAAAAGMSW